MVGCAMYWLLTPFFVVLALLAFLRPAAAEEPPSLAAASWAMYSAIWRSLAMQSLGSMAK